MACVCTICHGNGYTTEKTERGTTLTDRCWSCGGSGGWDEVDGRPKGYYGKPLVDSAERRKESQ
jgi:hypothetical protein